jgi:NAD(P)-dependent dehydrogenase (short-subunit alcohol dehydrogenase family)
MRCLEGKIALVTGGSRGAGRGIAVELAKAGATVYVTGRSVNGKSTHDWPGTIDDTVLQMEASGGKGIAVRCDHTNDSETESLINRIREEQGRLDILVNNVWGGNELPIENIPFWELSLQHWDHMFTAGVRAQLVTNHYAIPLMRQNKQGIIIHTTFWDRDKYLGHFYYDLAKNALIRMAYGLSIELKQDHIAVLAVSPGWMRTELVLKHFQTDENHWHEVEELKNTETPYYIGRAITALASDPNVMEKSGQVLRVGDLAKVYSFTDIDGRSIPPYSINS